MRAYVRAGGKIHNPSMKGYTSIQKTLVTLGSLVNRASARQNPPFLPMPIFVTKRYVK